MIYASILVVDDDERFRHNLIKLLIKEYSTVHGVSSGQEASNAITSTHYDILLLDMKMPGLNGLETLAKILDTSPNTKVLFLTGHASVDDAVEGMNRGAFDYLVKPVPISLIIHKINLALNNDTLPINRDTA